MQNWLCYLMKHVKKNIWKYIAIYIVKTVVGKNCFEI